MLQLTAPPFSCGFGGNPGGQDIWYTYKATCTGDVLFSLCNDGALPPTDYDTLMDIYDTANCNNIGPGTELNCSEDECSVGFQSVFTQSVVEGKTYILRVGGFSTGEGTGHIEIDPQENCLVEQTCTLKQNAYNKISIRNATPNKRVKVVWGFQNGKGTLSGGRCDGVPLGIKLYEPLAKVKMNNDGNKNAKIFIPPTSANKAFLQMVDLKTCTPGPVMKAILTDGTPRGGCVYMFDDIVPCPCFDASAVEGRGIDFMSQVLPDAGCTDFLPDAIQLLGTRDGSGTPPQEWSANASIPPFTSTIQCLFRDTLFGIDNSTANITLEEQQACIDVLLNSRMFKLNDCPPVGGASVESTGEIISITE